MNIIETYSDNVRFHPRIGGNYTQGIYGKKVLVLGESIYCCVKCNTPEVCKNQIKDIVKKQLDGEEKNPFYTLIPKLYIGDINKPFQIEEKIEFWNKVSFYEFIQTSVGIADRVRPTLEMWNDAVNPFFEILDILEPQVVLITGKELSNYVVRLFEERKKVFDSEKSFLIHNEVLYKNRNIDLVCIYHPSSGRLSYNIQEELFKIVK